MISRRLGRGKLISAKSFTIAMVLVNVGGLVLVEQKMNQAQVPDAYALDDGAAPMLTRMDAMPADRRVTSEVALAQPAAAAPPALATAPSALPPLPVWQPAFKARTAVAVAEPSSTSEPVKPALAVARIVPLHVVRAHHSSFSAAFEPAAPAAGLAVPAASEADSADDTATLRLSPIAAMPVPEAATSATTASPETATSPNTGAAVEAPQAPPASAELPSMPPAQPVEPAAPEVPAAA